jgi:ribonuclease R
MKQTTEERITRLLRGKTQGLSFQKIAHELGVSAKGRKPLQKTLHEMVRRGVVIRAHAKYTLAATTCVLRGTFDATLQGYGFVVCKDRPGEDIFIPARYTGGAMEGDTVEVFLNEKSRREKPEGRITRIVKKGREIILGMCVDRGGLPYLMPFDAPAGEEIALAPGRPESFSFGQIVAVERDSWKVTEVLGRPDDPGVDTRVVIQKHGLRTGFPAEVESETAPLSEETIAREAASRVDYRDWTTVTIDGEKAQDFDDAVSVRRLFSGNYLLGVHIADVSHYVRPDTPLDREAYLRGTSVYFPDRTLPMLPEKLSNDLCSLRPRRDRLTMSVVMEIDGKGEVARAEFHPSVIRTADRLTYDSVFKVFSGDEEERKRLAALVPDLELMRELARILRAKRMAGGSLDFDLTEPELVYSEGTLQSVQAFATNEAHKLIEDFMISANVAVAALLSTKGVPSMYRIHPAPAQADLEELRDILSHFGIFLPKPSRVTSKDLQKALDEAAGRPEEKFVNIRLLRALRLATYSEENLGHYGLGEKNYCHFTSPIRRYPDLIVHRALKGFLARTPHKFPQLAEWALHSSEQERLAGAAEKDLVEWRIYRLLKTRLGDEFMGTITDFTKAGMLVEIDDYFVDGMLAFADMGGDYFVARSRGALVGKRTGRTFELGDRVRVQLAAVDPFLRRMSLVWVPEAGKTEKRKGHEKTNRRRTR